VIIAAEGRGRRLVVAPDASEEDVRLGAESLVSHLTLPVPGSSRRHDLEIESIDGAPATRSPHAAALSPPGSAATA
jgi:hypothetical protein